MKVLLAKLVLINFKFYIMKKMFLTVAIFAGSLALFSFTGNDAKTSDFTEIGSGVGGDDLGFTSFTRYEESATTSDKGTWTKRYEKWDIGGSPITVGQIEKSLNSN